MGMRIVVVGGGIAGVSAAQAARNTQADAEIFLVCSEPDLPYYRTRILSLFSGGSEEKLSLRSYEWYIEQNIQVVRGRVTAISIPHQQVRFVDGSWLAYDKLVLATGAKVTLPEFPGQEEVEMIPLRTLADMRQAVAAPDPAVVLGDGPLAVEAAWALSCGGREVTLVGSGKRLLSHDLESAAATFLLHMLEGTDIRIALKGEISHYDGSRLVLKDGRYFPAGMILSATGIASNCRLGQYAGLDMQHGFVVDRHMATSKPDIWAAGDCAEYQGQVMGRWTVAAAQGKVAGTNAAGGDLAYSPSKHPFSMQAMGAEIWQLGDITAPDSVEYADPQSQRFVKFFFRDQRLAGAEMIGNDLPESRVKRALETAASKAEGDALFHSLFTSGQA